MSDEEVIVLQHALSRGRSGGWFGMNGTGGLDGMAALAWAAIGIPILWGFYVTLQKAVVLFRRLKKGAPAGAGLSIRLSIRSDAARLQAERWGASMDIEKDLARIALQEEKLRFTRFDSGVAWDPWACPEAGGGRARRRRFARPSRRPSYTLFAPRDGGGLADNEEWGAAEAQTSPSAFTAAPMRSGSR